MPSFWSGMLLASGAVGLLYEVVWLRRVGLLVGASAPANALTLAAFLGGLAIGAALAPRRARFPARWYAALEAAAALWALAFPSLLHLGSSLLDASAPSRSALAVALLLPPAAALGATWPVLATGSRSGQAASWYAANTAGGLIGVLLGTFLLLPGLGVRGTEVLSATVGLGLAGLAALRDEAPRAALPPSPTGPWPPLALLAAAALSGFVSLGLEVLWFRVAAVAVGATVQSVGLVLATFLGTSALGAAIGQRWPASPERALPWATAAVGWLALAGAFAWGELPYAYAKLYSWGGAPALLPGSAALAVLWMGGAPFAAGLSFALLVRLLGAGRAGALQAASSGFSILGSALTGLVLLPRWELDGALKVLVLANAVGASLLARRAWPLLVSVGLVLALPRWDRELFAVGVHLAVSEFADPSRAGIERYAREGWELLSYDHGPTGAVAVGRSLRSGNVWMSINGKFDASTGDDMPTQELSARLPLSWSEDPQRVLVVGLASGVTAGTALEDPRVRELWLVEIEPAVVTASHAFDHVNRRPLADARTRLLVEDARAVLEGPGPRFDVIISEPSNPWITGVSSLFTLEYWQVAEARLAPGGVFCQWVQLYGMGREELRALLRTFLQVFPDARLYETIGGSDVLLIAGGRAEGPAEPQPLLTAERLRLAAGVGWKNTDDHPLVEWRAPGWLHYDTGAANAGWLRGLAEAKSDP